MKLAFKANVIFFNNIYRPDIDINFVKYTQGGGAVYNSDKTACIVIMDILPENESVIKNALSSYDIKTIEELEYIKTEAEYKGFIDIMTKPLAGA
jgi:hypothetical protein